MISFQGGFIETQNFFDEPPCAISSAPFQKQEYRHWLSQW